MGYLFLPVRQSETAFFIVEQRKSDTQKTMMMMKKEKGGESSVQLLHLMEPLLDHRI